MLLMCMYKLHGHCCAVYKTGYIKSLVIKPLIDDIQDSHEVTHGTHPSTYDEAGTSGNNKSMDI